VHDNWFWAAYSLTAQSFDTSSEIEVFALCSFCALFVEYSSCR
jgi:hypothetical protein